MKRLFKSTVWSREGVSAADWRFRGIFRFVLPVTDLLFLWFGLIGWLYGNTAVENVSGPEWQIAWSFGITVTASLAFVGVIFPKLWFVEMVAKILLIGLVSSYVALFLIGGIISPNATAVAALMLILILLPVWRIADLGRVAWERTR